jgi:hypothetical protein
MYLKNNHIKALLEQNVFKNYTKYYRRMSEDYHLLADYI